MSNGHYSKMLSETISLLINSLIRTTESAQDLVKKLSIKEDKQQEMKVSQSSSLFANVFTKKEQNGDQSNMSEVIQKFSDDLDSIEVEWSEKFTACF